MRPRALLFDLFDTLVDLSMDRLPILKLRDRELPSTAAALHALVVRHRPLSVDDFFETLRASDAALREARIVRGREVPTLERFEALVERLDIADPALPRQLTETHMGLLREQVTEVAHHVPLLAAWRRAGVRVAVCSNFSHSETALAILEEAGLRRHLDAVLVSDAVGFRKPRPEIFRAALAAVDTAPAQALHVGDNLRADVAGAAALGLRTAWVTRRVADPEAALAAFEGPRPDFVIRDLAELPERLGSALDEAPTPPSGPPDS